MQEDFKAIYTLMIFFKDIGLNLKKDTKINFKKGLLLITNGKKSTILIQCTQVNANARRL